MKTIANKFQLGVINMADIYEETIKNITIILKKSYRMNSKNANIAVSMSPLKDIFDKNAEMAAHTSNEDWAKQIYDYWREQQND